MWEKSEVDGEQNCESPIKYRLSGGITFWQLETSVLPKGKSKLDAMSPSNVGLMGCKSKKMQHCSQIIWVPQATKYLSKNLTNLFLSFVLPTPPPQEQEI